MLQVARQSLDHDLLLAEEFIDEQTAVVLAVFDHDQDPLGELVVTGLSFNKACSL